MSRPMPGPSVTGVELTGGTSTMAGSSAGPGLVLLGFTRGWNGWGWRGGRLGTLLGPEGTG